MKKILHNSKGFTLIEALVSVTMLSIVIASTMSLAQSSIASNSYAQAQVTANYLAGEPIEYIRNIRDENYVNNQNWMNGINAACFSPSGCDVDTINDIFINCAAFQNATCPPLKFSTDISKGFYHHGSTGNDSVFTRTVKMNYINGSNNNEVAVKVIIKGSSGYFKNTPLVVVEHLFNWYRAPVEE